MYNDYFKTYNIIQMYLCKNMKPYSNLLKNKYDLIEYLNNIYPTLFIFDDYDYNDINILKNHRSDIYIIILNEKILSEKMLDGFNIKYKKIFSINPINNIKFNKNYELLNKKIFDINKNIYETNFFYDYGIIQIYFSYIYKQEIENFIKKYGLLEYNNINISTLFFGINSEQELNLFLNHIGKKYLLLNKNNINFIAKNNWSKYIKETDIFYFE